MARRLTCLTGRTLPRRSWRRGSNRFRRTPVSGAPRGPFCMMGACFDCLVEIDGVARQACMVEVCAGLDIRPAHQDREASDAL
ncbi:(2Fe-2S)-binding protein [Roseovarius sp. C7]|uniref:(2Fe-2S)-binding protein n=1 Tax=Roseovarius sp. C7 TaxID=3398643 RepID=UPI0039F72283